jgi:hypothetical protein
MRFACAESLRMHEPVLAVRSSRDQSWHTALSSATPPSFDEWDRHEQRMLDDYLDDLRAEFPAVTITGLLTPEATRFALAREGRDASLIVVGGRESADPGRASSGPNTLVAAYTFTGAVAVIPPTSAVTVLADRRAHPASAL